ncbi:MAG TPA: nucleotide exchange factor GrpE [Elusimicrobia bacterium]|nr:nucleotide exchange factor GrpE [Elusimicrobiota bacterium]
MSNPKANPKESHAKKRAPEEQPAPEQEPKAPEAAAPSAPSDKEKELFDQILRLKADFENYRKRVDRDKPSWERHGKVQLLGKLLPLYDVLLSAHEQAVRHGETLAKADDGQKTVSELVRGLELIFKEFTKLFESEGVKVVETVGKPFDFNLHEVLGQVETDAHPEGTVVEELARGYTLDGAVLRPAKVRIAKKKTLEEGS